MEARNTTPLRDPTWIPLQRWRQGCRNKPRCQRKFEEWVFGNSSAVLLANKPGELLTFPCEEEGLRPREVARMLKRLEASWPLRFRLLNAGGGTLKFLAYDPQRVQVALDRVPGCILCDRLGYPNSVTFPSFCRELKQRWNSTGKIPHEIGVVLGYPVEDVFGFMGILSLPCKGACGWQVYGCVETSTRLSVCFANARCRALAFLAQTAAA